MTINKEFENRNVHTNSGNYNESVGRDYYDLRTINIHETTKSSTIRKPIQAPPLPNHFVERPEVSEELKTRLLSGSSSADRTLVVSAIHGLGSVGKSTLAAALAHDSEIQNYFCDGILWTTLGQDTNVSSELQRWVHELERNQSYRATSIEGTMTHLQTLLYDKTALLVVDDAWDSEKAGYFQVGGPRCQVLVTTRNDLIAHVLRASIYNLDVMTPDQAMELLTKKLKQGNRELLEAERQTAAKLAQAVGYLPLALELGATQVARGTSFEDLLKDIRQEIARLKSFDLRLGKNVKEDEAKKYSLQASLNLSLKQLFEDERENFMWLGVLPEDATITRRMAATLWDMDERDAGERLQDFRSQALLLSNVALTNDTSTYRLHDLFHDLACNLLTAAKEPKRNGDLPGLGLKLLDAHGCFLERYREKTENGLWHTLPDDGYIHQRLVWHLEKTGKKEEIHKLLQEETPTGRNGWYEACDRLGQTANFVTDVAHAWRLAEEIFEDHPLQAISLQCRYALILASLNSLAANLPKELLVALVTNKVWTAKQGLAYALQSSNPQSKASLLTEIVDYLPQDLKEEALQKALAAATAIQDEYNRTKALSALTDKLSPELLLEALAAARAIQSDAYRAKVLSALADKLPQVLPEALAATRAIQDESYRTKALSALADKLPSELLPEALAAARAIQFDAYRAYALSALADKLPQLLPEALAAARAIQSEHDRADALSALADKLPQLLPEALTAARAIQSEHDRADALSALADKLPQLLPEALAAARAIQSESYRATALSTLADKLSKMQPGELFPLWQDTLHSLSLRTRQDFLQDIAALAPVICALGDRAAVAEVASAIQDVGQWWP